MRYLIALVCCILLMPSQAQACRGGMEETLFFKTIPDPQPDADVIAEISLPEVSDFGFPTAKVLKVFKTSDESIHPGSTISMRYVETSCGPDPISGSKGIVIANTGTDSKGNLVLYPYTYRPFDSRIFPPRKLPDGYDRRFIRHFMPLRFGKSIPQNFAVIMIGITGTELVYSVDFVHSEKREMSIDILQSNTIVAFVVPVGMKQLSIDSAKILLRGEGSHTKNTVVHTPKLDIDRPGFYYLATLDTDHPGQFQTAPLPEQLKRFHIGYGKTLKKLVPINFKWPVQ